MENKIILPSDYVVCIYVRLSVEDADTDEVKTESNSITAQRQLIRDYVKKNQEFTRCKVIERCDDGFTGTRFDTRPAFREMIELVKRGEINCIIVKDFSRFGRNYVELGDYLEQLFPFLGVRFISVNDGYDSDDLKDGETAGLSVAFQNLIYDYYSKELSAKASAAYRQMAEHGLYKSPHAPYGYRKDPENKRKLVIEPDEAVIVREIFDMRISGMNMVDIAKEINERGLPCPAALKINNNTRKTWHDRSDWFVWTAATIRNILKNEQYTGMLVSCRSASTGPGCKRKFLSPEEWHKVEGTHEAIVTREIFAEVQKMFKKIDMSPAVQKGYFRCGYCGRALRNQNLMNWTMKCRRGNLTDGASCAKVSLKNVKAMDCVLKAIQQKIRTYMDAEERRKAGLDDNDPQKEIQAVQKNIEKEKTAWMKLYDEYADGKMSREDFLQYKKEYDDRLEELKQRLETAEMRKRQMKADEGEDVGRFEEVLKTTELTQEIMNAFIDHIDVFEGDRIHIHWKFDSEG